MTVIDIMSNEFTNLSNEVNNIGKWVTGLYNNIDSKIENSLLRILNITNVQVKGNLPQATSQQDLSNDTKSPTARGVKNKSKEKIVQIENKDLFGDDSSNKKNSKKGNITANSVLKDINSSCMGFISAVYFISIRCAICSCIMANNTFVKLVTKYTWKLGVENVEA